MQFETTLQRAVEVSGIGLHSGVPVNLRITPAPAGSGIVFRRTDLDFFPISASWRHVARVSYATSLMRQGVLISTTEHLLSTLYSFAIDNATIEIDNLEVPILDGSGKPFVDLLKQAGVRTLRKKRKYLRVRRPVSVEEGLKRISIIPDDVFRLTCDIDFPAPIGKQSIEMVVSPERYAAELSPARTFGFEHELDQLREMGLIRGADRIELFHDDSIEIRVVDIDLRVDDRNSDIVSLQEAMNVDHAKLAERILGSVALLCPSREVGILSQILS